jgi:hypothetical protein
LKLASLSESLYPSKFFVFHHSDGRWTTVPIHKGKDVAKGTLHKILKDAGISYEEFKEMK